MHLRITFKHLRAACERLDQTDSTMREIATQLGYDDPSILAASSKKTQGCSPATYRRSVKG
jgi:AraC-like DNA-binding protein